MLPAGNPKDDKYHTLSCHWATVLDAKHPTLGFAAATVLQAEVIEDNEIHQQVCLENTRTLSRHPGD